jgi:predicted dehydrogenase
MTGAAPSGPRVALIGAAGHGATHLRRLTALDRAGRVRLAGVCDIRPIKTTAPLFTDHRALLDAVRPDLAVICTPPHTHLPIAVDAATAGADLLVEKPPVLSLAEHARLAELLAGTGRVCQVGFQALGSAALLDLLVAVRDGRLGEITSVAAFGAWWRDDAYFGRVPWAGRRAVGGRPVLDGALVNPFAHALMSALVIARQAGGGPPERIELERYRVADIEVDDTACLRVHLPGGPPILLAVSLRAAEFRPGEIVVTGRAGQARLEYPTDRLALPGQPDLAAVPGRVDLLENLIEHRATPDAVPLRVPLAVTAPFTAVAEAVAAAPPPYRITEEHLIIHDGGRAVAGVADLVRRAATDRALFRELAVPWAGPTLEVPVAQAAYQ